MRAERNGTLHDSLKAWSRSTCLRLFSRRLQVASFKSKLEETKREAEVQARNIIASTVHRDWGFCQTDWQISEELKVSRDHGDALSKSCSQGILQARSGQ